MIVYGSGFVVVDLCETEWAGLENPLKLWQRKRTQAAEAHGAKGWPGVQE